MSYLWSVFWMSFICWWFNFIIALCHGPSGYAEYMPGYSYTLLALTFNVKKCHCIAFGKNAASRIDPMNIGSCKIDWYDSIKYLGAYIVAGKRLSFDTDPVKRMFYAACNCIFSQAGRMDVITTWDLLSTHFIVCFARLYFQKATVIWVKSMLELYVL